MSDIIHLLPDSVANQIAAGEVIQRPASIIKELVENSLDAGATHIQVVVEDAGKSLVQVIDNGRGMSPTDARMAFERHATSKITQATDLFALRTMGFRGEALASIAAVAQVELRTRPAESELGVRLCIDGSKVVSQEPTSCAAGANFAVRNLFFNIPARRKFLKSNQTELSNILAEFERIALAHPDVAFTLHSAGAVMLDLPSENFRKRIVGIFGSRIDKSLIPIDVTTPMVEIKGFVGNPSSARKKNAHQFFFVNGRFMRHPYFAKAILTAYERLLPDGMQVPFFVDFQVDPARIDVNIHPTKTEIKFEDDAAIFQILLASVRESLGKFGAVPAIEFDQEGSPDIPAFNAVEGPTYLAPPQIHFDPNFNPFASSSRNGTEAGDNAPAEGAMASAHGDSFSSPHFNSSGGGRQSYDWQRAFDGLPGSGNGGHEETEYFSSTIGSPSNPGQDGGDASLLSGLGGEQLEGWGAQVSDILQFHAQYLFVPTDSGITIVDQHRAHSRILYEHYLQQLQNHQAPSQRLMFPEMLCISPSESVVLEQIMPQLTDIGFELSPLGGGSYSVLGVPTDTEGLSPINLVNSILADAVQGQADADEAVKHLIAAAMARKVAIPVGQILGKNEMQRLVANLFACQSPAITPSGLPTYVMLSTDSISRMF